MPAEIGERATSLAELAGRTIDRVELLGALLGRLDVEVRALDDGMSPLGRYRGACATLGSRVRAEAPGGALTGLAIAIDDHGALVLDTAGGAVAVTSGDVIRLSHEVGS
jgi:BirA family transcriptional regulator, biotin operon repressor / biotin---[acetyl-CoA-carboxylase] ligase